MHVTSAGVFFLRHTLLLDSRKSHWPGGGNLVGLQFICMVSLGKGIRYFVTAMVHASLCLFVSLRILSFGLEEIRAMMGSGLFVFATLLWLRRCRASDAEVSLRGIKGPWLLGDSLDLLQWHGDSINGLEMLW